jgi:hypothetical protein
MGFLRHDTNDVILDAVLTDKGRELLAAQDGSFQIAKFTLSDEDVDYNVVKEFGRVVGKEKIEKNTPVLEALTNTSIMQKSSLVSISSNNSTLSYLPFTVLDTGNDLVELSSIGGISLKEMTLTQKIDASVNSPPQDIINYSYSVEMNNLFLSIPGTQYSNVSSSNIATYRLSPGFTDQANNEKLSELKFTITTRNINPDSYSSYIKNKIIRTFVTVIGNQDGSETTFEVQITTA